MPDVGGLLDLSRGRDEDGAVPHERGAMSEEWLCERENVVHPVQRDGIIQPCPDCGAYMTPTSPDKREITALRARLARWLALGRQPYRHFTVQEDKLTRVQQELAAARRALEEAKGLLSVYLDHLGNDGGLNHPGRDY